MDGRKQKPMIPIACRYIPYDRYFLTHGDPTWKVKHLKQRILARALSLPIDIRRLDPDYVYVPPSTSVNRRKTGTGTNKKPSKEGFSASGIDDDADDEPWNAKKEGREGTQQHAKRRAPSPITFAGAEANRDSDAELGEAYFSAASVASDGAGGKDERAASPSGSSSASEEGPGLRVEGRDDEGDDEDGDLLKPKMRRRGGSVSPIEFANPIVLRRQKSASMGAFLYEKGVEAGLVMPLPKSEKAKGKQKAKDLEPDAEGDGDGDADEEGGDGEAGEGEGDAEEELEAGYQVDDDDSEDWSDDYDEDMDNYLRSPTDPKETKEMPAERPETPPPGGRILPGGDGAAMPVGSGAAPGGKIATGGGGVHFAAPTTPRLGGKNKKRTKGASIVGPLSKIAKTVTGTSSHQPSHSMSSSQSQPQHRRSHSQMVVYGPPPDPSEQILTLPFALVRFSTGQLLEDDLPISWYDLRPYELLEVHFVLQPRRFEVSVRLGAILTRTVRGAPFSMGGGFAETNDDKPKKREKGMSGDPLEQLALAIERERDGVKQRDGFGGPTAVDVPPRPEMFFHTETRELVSLPRGDMDAYVKPYWEGWARALRVMAPAREFNQHYQNAGLGYVQPGYGRAGPGKYGYAPSYNAPHGPGNSNAKYAAAEHPAGPMMGGGGGAGMVVWDPAMNTYGEEKEREAEVDVDALGGGGRPLSPSVGRHQHPYHNQQQSGHGYPSAYGASNSRPGKGKPKLEWRERWVVVRDGYIYLYKNRYDPSPTHQLALSALLSLKDAEHLAQHQHTRERRDREAQSAIPPGGKAFSPERAQTSHGDERRKQHRRSTSTPRPSTSGLAASSRDYRLGPAVPGSSGVPPLPQGRVLDPEELERKRKLDRDLEALTRWDDFGASFNFGKKEKGKDKNRVRSKDKEGDQQKLRGRQSAGAVGDRDGAEDWRRQKSVDVPREREKHKSEDRDWLAQERDREEAEKHPRTYIPASRDDAEAAGMKIVCAKFRYRGSGPPPASSRPKQWYTSTGPSLAGETMLDAEVTEHTRREEQVPNHPTRAAAHAQQRPPTVPGRQMGLTATVSSGALPQASVSRSESIAPTSMAASSGKFGLSGLFGKDKDNEDHVARKEKEDRKREEKERKAREKEHRQLEKDRKKEDRRKKEEEEFRGISSSSSNVRSIPVYPSLPRNDLSSLSSTPTIYPSENYSSTTANSMTLPKDDVPTTPRPEQSRPQLKISPISTQQNTWDEDLDDYDSDISFSSPVFAHSTESDDDDFMLARDRRGYRYGGYHAPASRKTSVPNVAFPNNVAEEAAVRAGAIADKGKAKEMEESIRTVDSDSKKRHLTRHSADQERGEWLVLDLGSDSAFTSLLRIFHRQSPSIPSSFLPHAITTTFTSPPNSNETPASQHGSMPSSPIASQESGQDASRSGVADNSSQDDEAAKPIHPEGLSTFMPHGSNRKAMATPALPYPEWRIELVKYARFAGMREMDRPLHLAYTGWGRDKKASNGENPYSLRNKKSDSIWARRTRSSFVRTRTAERKQTSDHPDDISTTGEVIVLLEPKHDDAADEEGQERQKRMSLASHVSTIKASKSSASREETPMDTLAPLPAGNVDDQWKPSFEGAGTASSPESSGDETDGEVVLEVVSDEGFAYGRQDEEGAVAEALGWLSDDSDEEESEFEWAAWVTDLPRQYALSKQRKTESERQPKPMLQPEQARREESTQLSPMMFANPFVPDMAEPVMVYDTPRKGTSRPPTPPPKDPEEERIRYVRDKRRWEPHATSVSEPLVHSHSNVSATTLHLHHSSPSTSTLNQIRTPSRAPSSSQLSSQSSANPHPTLSSPSSIDSLADGQRQSSARFQGRAPSLNINPMQRTRLRLQSNPTSPLDGTFSPPLPYAYERENSSQTFPRPRHQRQHSRSVSGGDSIFESNADIQDQEMHRRAHEMTSPSRPSGLHHSASMPSTRVASAPSSTPRSPHTVTFSPIYDEYGSGSFQSEPSMENMPDDGQPSAHRQAIPLTPSLPSRYAVPQSPRHYSGHPPPSPRVSTDLQSRGFAKPPSSVLKKRRSDLGKGRAGDSETDLAPPLSPTLSETGSTFGPMQGNYSASRGPSSSNFPSVAFTSGPPSNTPLDKARALVRRVRSGSSLGGHEIQTVVEEHPQWESEATGQQRDGQAGISAGASASSIMRELPLNQPKKKKSAIDRLVRGFESSLDFMDGR